MGPSAKRRSILHVDLDPFLVSVERSLDPSLRGRPVIVGGREDGSGSVAAASGEARARGVRAGMSMAAARRVCPEAEVRAGDFDVYARYGDEVTGILQSASRRVERLSADEAYVDLTPESHSAPTPVTGAETIKDEIQRRLGLDVSLGLAGSRLAARVASTCARPRGLLVVLPGYESSFLARQPVSFLPELPPHLETALTRSGLATLGQVADAEPDALAALVGALAAVRLQEAARGEGDPPIAVTAPPTAVQEETTLRDRQADRAALSELLEALVARAIRRLRPFQLHAGTATLEVRRADGALRRTQTIDPPSSDTETLVAIVQAMAEPLLDPPSGVRAIQLRLGRLHARAKAQPSLFPARRVHPGRSDVVGIEQGRRDSRRASGMDGAQ